MVQAVRSQPTFEPAADADPGAAAWITRLPRPLAGAPRGPLAGLQFAAKDNIDVGGVPTTAGCPAFEYTPGEHASVVQRLLDAGASVLGKTNLDQFACGLNGTRSPYGPVPNAFDPRFISGGSSSGSAHVVATGQADFALGTDTAGSGRVPAGLNNIVGLKPSRGLVSARGVVPAAQSIDCVSIFAGSVGLAARVLAAAAGPDPLDPYSRRLALAGRPYPASFRFGVPDALPFFGDRLARAAFEQAIVRLRQLGGTPVPVDHAPLAKAAELLYDSALVAERYAAIRGFFDGREDAVLEPVRSIVAGGCGYSAADYCEAQTRLRILGQAADRMWDRIDVLVVPTTPTHYTIAQLQADPIALNRNLGAYTNFVNLLDYAALAVPSSIRPDGLPFGITFVGRCGSDWQLADLGQRYHHATGLTQGATGRPLPGAAAIAGLAPAASVQLAVVGAHLSGMPLNGQLTERGARLLRVAETAPDYRLYALPDTTPAKPGLVRVAAGGGAPIALELWEMPLEHYGSFVAAIPAPLGIGTLRLADGSAVQGFVCEAAALAGAQDITHHGGWRAYMAALAATPASARRPAPGAT
ncbi:MULTISPECIES: allophanate hydrolase [Ramlibacter]|uniref:Allophanate hydrolase n=1 Tax=Ramlibacter pinisoli TaxID=2682844 RepID=A0A6N8J0K3_9BURK|nr:MULTISPECIES: allophanate hydrolase [Ramlibacter]MBA2962876.1 allophanate hydrolase [Ramlibacter sp. CGMCC 1.13660]MVQ32819.1 allophanate hydrolase [Ramlibacter pinisoli]